MLAENSTEAWVLQASTPLIGAHRLSQGVELKVQAFGAAHDDLMRAVSTTLTEKDVSIARSFDALEAIACARGLHGARLV
jgi:hypothetical protein